jgi:hypothetical protein
VLERSCVERIPNDEVQEMDKRNYIRYNPKPVPDSHIGLRKRCVGVRSALRQRLEERIRAMEILERT